ncbi:zinc finger BED domain-containing protein 4-like isoform X2 [Perca flavescens]|uniref:zinc finger BED domain-containing protein 4-like isoform X2 n=1 Tax=Perca flavescens TaxID=8167 RepID=UPI00106E733A|nr:zinc finger BED domain-containing protein 4-like isoform X2 [Perca flavescens]
MSTRLCESIAFKQFANVLKPKFKTPGAARVNSLIGAKMDMAKQKLKEIIKDARKLTLCVDGWSKTGLTASFMGVSACFYHPARGQVHHALLNLHQLEHPHTGESIAHCIDRTLDAWGIGEDKVLLIVTDNGSNIVEAVRLLRDTKREQSHESDGAVSQAQPRGVGDEQDEMWMESEGSDEEDEDEEETEIGGVDGENNKFQRMPCLAHSLQLTLKDAMKHTNVHSVITKARKLVHTVRKSSAANEELIKRCGKTLVRDCSTRWNSTFDMLRRLLETSAELNQLLENFGMDTLLTSDWAKLENLVKLLEPFAVHTDQLQSDSQSLSRVVPCLLNLEAHLLMTAVGKPLAQILLKSLRERFAGILSPDSIQFDATPAAACLMDPSVSLVLQSPDTVPLKRASQSFVQNLAAQYHPPSSQYDGATSRTTQTPTGAPLAVLQKYRFLASRIEVNVSSTNQPNLTDGLLIEMEKYVCDVKQGVFNETPLQFWRSREAVYPKLAPVALDLVSAPASQAFVERIFSLCGLLSSGLRNRTTTSLEQRVFLKINKKLLLD